MGIESFWGFVALMGYHENKMIGRTLGRISSKDPCQRGRKNVESATCSGVRVNAAGGMQELTTTVPAGTAAKRLSPKWFSGKFTSSQSAGRGAFLLLRPAGAGVRIDLLSFNIFLKAQSGILRCAHIGQMNSEIKCYLMTLPSYISV